MAAESARSSRRRATRTLALATMLSSTAPERRCVDSTRWIPRLRPRWAMSTTPATNSGSCLASVANSSITISNAAGASSGATAIKLPKILGATLEQCHPALELGAQRHDRAPRQAWRRGWSRSPPCAVDASNTFVAAPPL